MTKRDYDIQTPDGRRRAMRQFEWADHGILRHRWHNFAQFADGAFRSNHPTTARFEAYAAMGIKTVLTLRGGQNQPQYLFEAETCARLGLTLECVQMAARKAPVAARLGQLYAMFDRIERPFLMHCKSGADRTGLAAALYLLEYEGADIATAKAQLSFDFIHIRRTATGVLDHFLDTYEARFNQTGIGARAWIATEYDAEALKVSFAAKQKALQPWQGWR
ncbi:phosphatase domain-containing protein [Yoonia sp. MH D7]